MKNFSIKVFGLICFLAIFISCGKIPDGTVEPRLIDFIVITINSPVSFTYSNSDSSVVTSLQISNVQSVKSVWCQVATADGKSIKYSLVPLNDDGNLVLWGDKTKGDGIYSAKFVMGKTTQNGKYEIEYFVEDNIRISPDNIKKVGTSIFSFDNGQINYPPVLSNLIIPLSVNRGDSFTFTIKADDQNGLSDIAQVYFKLVRPDGTTAAPGPQDDNGSGFFLMHDDGNSNYGDVQAGNGIYSFKNSFGTTSQTGTWNFEFQAKDKGTPSKLSNLITFNLTVN